MSFLTCGKRGSVEYLASLRAACVISTFKRRERNSHCSFLPSFLPSNACQATPTDSDAKSDSTSLGMVMTGCLAQLRGILYRPFLQGVPSARGMGRLDLNFDCSIVCPILPWMMGICQKWLGSWARWWNTQIKFNQTHVRVCTGRRSTLSPIFC